MIDSQALLTDLQREVTRLHTDLRARCDAEPAVDAKLNTAYDSARAGQRTALTYKAWREEELTNVAVAWVLACVFIRFLEDNALVETLHLAGPDAAGIGRARDQQIVFFREHPGLSEREYLEHVFTEIGTLPGMADLFDRRHNPLWTVGPTGDAARAFIEFWRRADAGSGRPVHDFSDADWNSRFLGDLYQDLSEAARKRYALLQTPVFIEQFILDRTLTPAIETFGFREVRMIDPTCGSGHFLLGGFARLYALWNEALPGEVPSVVAQHALDQVFGVDLNPNVVAIARFRLLLAALRVTGTTKLRNAYNFKIHIAAGDALLHGRRFRTHEGFTSGPQRTFDTEEVFRDELKHHYEVEDVEALHRILGQQYHSVVGNPPYIAVKDRALSELYRTRYPSCHGRYSLSMPFMERFFDLAIKGDGAPEQLAGFVGQITSNAFMKREFGKKLIEEFLPRWDVTHVIDTAGAFIPGHGTPTVILFGKNQPPVSSTIRTVLGIRGEPSTPENPALGVVWQAIQKQIDHPGSTSEWVSAGESPRSNFHKHPWSIGGGGAAELKDELDASAEKRLGDLANEIGITSVTGEDDVYALPDLASARRLFVEHDKPLLLGDMIRDWTTARPLASIWLYDKDFKLLSLRSVPNSHRILWLAKSIISRRKRFGTPMVEKGLSWYEWQEIYPDKLRTPLTIALAEIASHNHFVLDRGGKIFKNTASVIKLSSRSSEDDHIVLLGLLNSSTICFFMKQTSHQKQMMGGDGIRIDSKAKVPYQFASTQLHKLPIPAAFLSGALRSRLLHLAKQADHAAQQLSAESAVSVIERLASAAGTDGRASVATAKEMRARLRSRLVFLQEQIDFTVYAMFGLGEESLLGANLDELDCGIPAGSRPFEMAAGSNIDRFPVPTALPPEVDARLAEVWRKRVDAISNSASLTLIEDPHYKRRWMGRQGLFNHTREADEFETTARDWLLARLEGYFHEGQRVCELKDGFAPAAAGFAPASRPAFTTTNQLAEIAKTDRAFQAVAEQLMGGSGFSVPKLVRELVESASVPFLPGQRYKPSGLLKRHDWEQVWELQRREDAIDAAEKVDEPVVPEAERTRRKAAATARKKAELGDIPVPPKYVGADFKKTVWWSHRGKLDVPKERWITYPGIERSEDPSPVIAWAGWDAAQQARALAEYYVDGKQTFGFPPEKLTLLLAGLLELQPWLNQWHHEIDHAYGVSPAEAIKGFLDAECQSLGVTREDLERVRMGG